MRVVADANVIAAAAIRPDGHSARQLERPDIEWLAPALIVQELDEHRVEFAARAGLGANEWAQRVTRLLAIVRLIPQDQLAALDENVMVNRADRVDPDDAAYIAAVIAGEADYLWTLDKRLQDEFPGLAVGELPGPEPSD